MARLGWNHFGVELLARSDEPQPACTETRNDAHPKVHDMRAPLFVAQHENTDTPFEGKHRHIAARHCVTQLTSCVGQHVKTTKA